MDTPTPTINDDRQENLPERIRSLTPSLTASSVKVAERVLADPHTVVWMSAAELARASGTSVGSVVRFCAAVGFPGYQDFKLKLSAQLPHTPLYQEISDRRAPQGAAETVLETTLKGFATTISSLDLQSIREAAELLRQSSHVLLPAAGPSQPLAMALGQWMSRSQYSVAHPTDFETQLAIAEQLNPEAVCFAISHSGTTANTLATVRAAAARGATIIALTSFRNTELAQLADVTIVAGAGPTQFHNADTASRPIHLAVINALTAEILEQPHSHI